MDKMPTKGTILSMNLPTAKICTFDRRFVALFFAFEY